ARSAAPGLPARKSPTSISGISPPIRVCCIVRTSARSNLSKFCLCAVGHSESTCVPLGCGPEPILVPQEMTMDTMMVEHRTLPDDMLKRFAERVGKYDRENRFFQEDFDDLKRAGYLTINVPKELGGKGFTLAESCREQRRLAYYAPATALGI